MNNTETIKKTSLRNLYQNGYFKTLSGLNINSSNYPFITLLNKAGRASNLYFSKSCSQLVMDNFTKGDSLTSFLSDADCVQVENEAGETRFKIVKSGGKYATDSSLSEAFGSVVEEDFDFKKFQMEYESQVAVQDNTVIQA